MSTVNATDGRKNFFELINRANKMARISRELMVAIVPTKVSLESCTIFKRLQPNN